jgi:ribose transport system substrate-binding protein
MKVLKSHKAKAISVAVVAIGFLSAGAMAETPSWCGPNKASIAFLDGFGGNSWRRITTASAQEEAKKCPSITEYHYADAQGDTQKAIADIKSMAARGINAMVVFADAGPAALPALTAAHEAGVAVVPYRVTVGGEEGKNYYKFVGASFVEDGVNWGKWIKAKFPSGANMLFLSGPAGNSVGLEELQGLKSVLGPEYKFLNPEPFHVTNWDPALTQQILTAEVAKHDKIDVIISDFGASLVGGLPAFAKSGRSIPSIVTESANILGCYWKDNEAKNPDFEMQTVGSGNDNGRLAVQWAAAKATGGTPPSTATYVSAVFEDSISGKPSPVQCRADLSGDIYLSAEMSPEDQQKAINQ